MIPESAKNQFCYFRSLVTIFFEGNVIPHFTPIYIFTSCFGATLAFSRGPFPEAKQFLATACLGRHSKALLLGYLPAKVPNIEETPPLQSFYRRGTPKKLCTKYLDVKMLAFVFSYV